MIRALGQEDDLGPAIFLLQKFFREEGFDISDAIIAGNAYTMAGLNTCILLVAEVGEACVGVATFSLDFGIEYGWSAELGDLYVDPGWRGRGVARALMSAGESLLRNRGIEGYQVTLTPFAQEQRGLKSFYEAAGFKSEGRVILWKALG